MEQNPNKSSQLFMASCRLMAISGLLMLVCSKVVFGILLWIAAACLFYAAKAFRKMEDAEQLEEPNHEQTDL